MWVDYLFLLPLRPDRRCPTTCWLVVVVVVVVGIVVVVVVVGGGGGGGGVLLTVDHRRILVRGHWNMISYYEICIPVTSR